jgi:hypothetical protein
MITSANFRNCCFQEAFCLISNSTIIEPPHVNSVLQLTHSISNDLGGKKGQIRNISDLPRSGSPDRTNVEPLFLEDLKRLHEISVNLNQKI